VRRGAQYALKTMLASGSRAKTKGLGVATQALVLNGEPVGIRTRDLLIKSQLLYQLSYRPSRGGDYDRLRPRSTRFPNEFDRKINKASDRDAPKDADRQAGDFGGFHTAW